MNSLTSVTIEPNDAFADIFSMIDASFCVAEFDLTGNVIRVNDNFLALTGFNEEEILGQHHSMFLADDVVEAPEYGLCWMDLRAGKSKRTVLPWITKSGDRKWVEETTGPIIDATGRVVRIIRLGVDVTDRVHSMMGLKSALESGFDEVDQSMSKFDQSYGDASLLCRQAQSHLEIGTMVTARLACSVDETAQRLRELRTVADRAYEHAIEGDGAIVSLEEAVDVLRDCARADPVIIEQINVLEKCLSTSKRISAELRSDLQAMLSRAAVVSLAIDDQSRITHQVRSEMHNIQAAIEASQGLISNMIGVSEQVAKVVCQAREASVILAR